MKVTSRSEKLLGKREVHEVTHIFKERGQEHSVKSC